MSGAYPMHVPCQPPSSSFLHPSRPCNTATHRPSVIRGVAPCASVSGVQQVTTNPPVDVAPQAVLFDMDGVLVNSEDLSREYVLGVDGVEMKLR